MEPSAPEPPRTDPTRAPAGDELDAVLGEYEQRKQREAARMVARALEIEAARRKGAELLREHALRHARDVAGRLRQAGHRVVYQESLGAYPPNLRLHLYPKAGPLDGEEVLRWTFELTWGDPRADRMCATRWTSAGLADMVELDAVVASDVDELWVREQFLAFLRHALALS